MAAGKTGHAAPRASARILSPTGVEGHEFQSPEVFQGSQPLSVGDRIFRGTAPPSVVDGDQALLSMFFIGRFPAPKSTCFIATYGLPDNDNGKQLKIATT